MNTKKIAVELRLSHWAGIMRERVDSGLSISAYCKREGFHDNIYYYWQRKLREAACEQLVEAKADTRKTELAPLGFTEVKIAEPLNRPMISGNSGQGAICFDINGIRFKANSNYPPELIAGLIRGLS